MAPIVLRNVPPEGWKSPEERLAFSAWGESASGFERLPTISIFSAHNPGLIGPAPCPICGHPTGDCTDHVPSPTSTSSDSKGEPMIRTTSVQGDATNDPTSNLFVCPEDVVEDITPPGSRRVSHRLVARKGETITRERAVQLGLVGGEPPPVPGIPNADVVTKEGAPASDMVAT